MPLVTFEQWELIALALALVVTVIGLALNKQAAAPPTLTAGKKKPKKGTMPKKNSKQKKQAQKQAEKKKANKTKAGNAEPVVAIPVTNIPNDAKPDPEKLVENASDSDSESDDDSDDDMEYMAKCMGIKVKKDDSKDKKTIAPARLSALLEQAEKEPEKIVQIDLPLHALHIIVSFCKDDPNLKQNLKTQSLFEFSLAAAESWETAGLKSARTKLNQKAQKAIRKKEIEERGDDQDGASVSEPATGHNSDDEYDEDDDDFMDDYFSAKGHGKSRYNMGGKGNTFKAAKSRAHSTMKRASQRAS